MEHLALLNVIYSYRVHHTFCIHHRKDDVDVAGIRAVAVVDVAESRVTASSTDICTCSGIVQIRRVCTHIHVLTFNLIHTWCTAAIYTSSNLILCVQDRKGVPSLITIAFRLLILMGFPAVF